MRLPEDAIPRRPSLEPVIRLAPAVLLAFALALGTPGVASAHVPVLEPGRSSDDPGRPLDPYPGAVEIEPPHASLALYGYLAEAEAFDVYTFVMEERFETEASVLVPADEDLIGFRPTVTLQAEVPTAPLDPEMVARVTSPLRRDRFFEPFTFETLLRSEQEPVKLEEGRRYYLRVRPGRGPVEAGPYVVAFSGPEEFTLGEVAATAVRLPRIWLGLYGQAPFEPLPLLWFATLLALAIIARKARRVFKARRGGRQRGEGREGEVSA